MELASTTFNNSSCFDYSTSPVFVGVIAVQATCSFISVVAVLLMIGLAVLFKKYRFFTQRLILYLAMAELIKSMVEATNVVSFWSKQSDSLYNWCVTLAFLQQIVVWWVMLATTCIMVDIFIKVKYSRSTETLERVYVVITFLTPILLTSWIPFIFDAYGPVGPVCWIRNKNSDSDCSTFLTGAILQVILYLGPVYLVIVVILVLLIMSLILLRQQSRLWVGKFDPVTLNMKKRMKTEVRPLLAYPIIILSIHIPLTIGFVAGSIGISATATILLWYSISLVYHLQGIFLVCAFTLDPETRRKLTKADILVAIRNWCSQRHQQVREYPAEEDNYEESTSTSNISYEKM